MAKSVHDFLVGGLLEDAGGVFVARSTRQFGEVAVLDVGHRLASESGFEVLEGFDVGTCHLGLLCGDEVAMG